MDAPILILITLLVYFISIIILKRNGFKHKVSSEYSSNCCPCMKKIPLERVKRNYSDKLVNLITFKMFNFKRYVCRECNWQGLRWENKFKRKF